MTITSRRLARRCRERLATNRSMLPCPTGPAEGATVGSTETSIEVHQEKVDAAK